MSATFAMLQEMMESRDNRIAELEAALKNIAACAAFEQEKPTGLGMTCLSIIEKEARKALSQIEPKNNEVKA